MLRFLLARGYPKEHIAVETIIWKRLGESGRNTLRCDAIVYDEPAADLAQLNIEERIKRAVIVAEVKRDSKKQNAGITYQLGPALKQAPSMNVMGVYWDDVSRFVFAKQLKKDGKKSYIEVTRDAIENLPEYGGEYRAKALTLDQLSAPDNLVSVLMSVANVMRSHGVNDEHLRYKETVKIILARYCDEREASASKSKELSLQVRPGTDPGFKNRIDKCYRTSAKRYSNAKTLFAPVPGSELPEIVLKDIVLLIQGIRFSAASKEVMQQVFMSFVPAVFKKSLDQYFTPISLIDCMVSMVRIGPNDKIADPGMGTADFLTAAMMSRLDAGEQDAVQRVYGIDIDQKAFDLAVINMVLHKDGQSNLMCMDSIKNHAMWAEEMDVVLCNPPFGENSIERRPDVLKHYALGHEWQRDGDQWRQTNHVLPSQQLGILFLERCFKLLCDGGRLAIILPEGYLCTPGYGYVRKWIVDHVRILSLVELPRRIFLKSDADLRSAILCCEKVSKRHLRELIKANYPIHAELVRKVGYKLGAGFPLLPKRDPETGAEIRDHDNRLIPDSDFAAVKQRYAVLAADWNLGGTKAAQLAALGRGWAGGWISDVLNHPLLDLKPRRLAPKAIENKRSVLSLPNVALCEIAEVIEETIDILEAELRMLLWRHVEGQDIRAVEGIVQAQEPTRGWYIANKKGATMYRLKQQDIIIGLVRPERRNVGMLLTGGGNLIGAPDGIAVVRVRSEHAKEFPQGWLLAALRSEAARLQFWTESGGTSYGKLTLEQIRNVRLPRGSAERRKSVAKVVGAWFENQRNASEQWNSIGTSADRKPILNSPIFGLEWPTADANASEDFEDMAQ